MLRFIRNVIKLIMASGMLAVGSSRSSSSAMRRDFSD